MDNDPADDDWRQLWDARLAEAAVLLCIGITEEELQHCRQNGHSEVLARLKQKGVYPYTDTDRDSVTP